MRFRFTVFLSYNYIVFAFFAVDYIIFNFCFSDGGNRMNFRDSINFCESKGLKLLDLFDARRVNR